MADRAEGGPIVGTVVVRIERLGVGLDGLCVYSVNGQPPTSVLRRLDRAALNAALSRVQSD